MERLRKTFDDAIVDGFDFDIENKDQTGYAALATQLRKYFSTELNLITCQLLHNAHTLMSRLVT